MKYQYPHSYVANQSEENLEQNMCSFKRPNILTDSGQYRY